MRVVPALVWARLRHRPLRSVLVVLGLAIATVLPVVAQGSGTVVASQALRHGIAGLPAGQRSLIVSYPGIVLSSDELAHLDTESRAGLARLTGAPVHRQLLFRRIADATGASFFLGAADDLTASVRITSGRAPASCTPVRCEVVVVGIGSPTLDPTLGIVVVGTALRTDPLLLTGTFDPGHDAPLLLADGVAKAQLLTSLELFQRSYGWVAPLDLDRVERVGVDDYVATSAEVSDQLLATHLGLVLTAPDSVLQSERDRADLSSRRFALLSGAGTALLLGFAMIAAIGLRRDQQTMLGLLRRRGASRRTLRTFAITEAVVPVVVGTGLGLFVGGLLAAVMASRAGLPAWASGLAAVQGALTVALVGAAVATVVVLVTSSWAPGARPATAWRVVDAAVLVGLATAGLAISRGVISAASLDGGTDPLLTVLPAIAVLAGGLLAARGWPFLAAWVGRVLPTRWLASRLALLGVVRRPLRPVATVAFLTAATAIVVFAGGYRSTLEQGAVDQAAFEVPLDARITTGSTLERPLDVQTAAEYGSVVRDAAAFPVVRTSTAVRVSSSEATPVEVVGVDPAALPLIRSWAHVAGGLDPAAVGHLIETPRVSTGIPVPSGAVTLSIRATGDLEQLSVVVWFRSGEGRDYGVTLTLAGKRWAATLPDTRTGLTLISMTLAESVDYATHHQHLVGEGLNDQPLLTGRMLLGAPQFGPEDGPSTRGSWTGWGSEGARVVSTADTLTISYGFTGALVVVRPLVEGAQPLPVLVDPGTAARARGGLLELAGGGNAPLQLRVVGTLPRFPTAGPAFILADARALAEALDARQPGTGSVAELWLWAPDQQTGAQATALAQPPYDRLTVNLRSERELTLRTDPVAAGAQSLLTFSALLALLVGVLALVLLVLAERRDESAELYAWESDGVSPGTLRGSLFVRALAVLAVALPAGVVTGLVLSQVTTTLVALTAVGTTPRPPLTLSVGPLWVAAVIGTGALLGVVASGGVAMSALRERMPRRPEQDLR